MADIYQRLAVSLRGVAQSSWRRSGQAGTPDIVIAILSALRLISQHPFERVENFTYISLENGRDQENVLGILSLLLLMNIMEDK